MVETKHKQSKWQCPDILLLFKLNSQSNYTLPLCAHEAKCWLAGIVYGSVRAILFPNYRARTGCEHQGFYWVYAQNGQLEDCEEQLAEFDNL